MELSAFRSMMFRSKKLPSSLGFPAHVCQRATSSPQKPHFPRGTNNGTINWVDPHEPSVQFWREIIRFNGIYALTSQLWRTCSEFWESTWISVWLWKFPRISMLLEQCSKPPWIIPWKGHPNWDSNDGLWESPECWGHRRTTYHN